MANTLEQIKLSGVTYDLIDSTALHTLDDTVTSGGTNAVKGSGVYNAIQAVAQAVAEQHYQTSGDVQNIVDASISGKANSSDVYTKSETYTKGETDQAIEDAIVEAGGVTSGAVQSMIDSSISGKTNESDFTAFTSSTDTALGTKFQNVAYDSNSKRINFFTESATTGTPAAYVDATDFIKDGMVSNVEIKTIQSGDPAVSVTVLAITFNADAGKEEIDIPISSIFDATNYYTKSETDAAISAATSGKVDTTAYTAYTAATETTLTGKANASDVYTKSETYTKGETDNAITAAVSGKADTSAVTAVNDTLTGHTADTTIHVTSSDKTTWSGKQDALVSGTNIKTINGNSILGSGDITVQTLPTVSGTTLIFS